MVLLSAKNIRLSRPNKKLDYRFLGPFRITEVIGKQAYRLELPDRYSKLHPVFHVSLLEPWRGRASSIPTSPSPEILMDDGDEWEVSEVLDHREGKDGEVEYLVRWAGYPTWEDSYEPAANLDNTQEAVQKYLQGRRAVAAPPYPRRNKPRRRRF
jgi:hypothetical protein